MTIKDDRTEEQRATHTALVVGRDKGMSGWGGAKGGISYAAWACRMTDLDAVFEWVKGRGDMKHVRVVYGCYFVRGRNDHLHIYVVNDGHPALEGK